MEESVERRERLKAMRMEASQDANYNDAEHSHGLSNPLVETTGTSQGLAESCATPRFDYYTDPLSAFSGNKRRSKVSPPISQDYSTPPRTWRPATMPSPAFEARVNYSPDQRMQQAQDNYTNTGGMASPSPSVWNGSGVMSNYGSPFNSTRGGNLPSPTFAQGNSPIFNSAQGRGYWFSNAPHPSSGLGSNPGFHSEQVRGPWFSNSPAPGSGRGGHPEFGQGNNNSATSGQGRGQSFSNNMSPGPSFGRGRGRWSGPNGGGGRVSNNHVTAEERPDIYYNKSMVEDPWKFLKPVIWRTATVQGQSSNMPGPFKSWLPNSVSMKKAKVSESPRQSSSEPSLAEYLAASFNEAAN